jgi:IS5 family transposase
VRSLFELMDLNLPVPDYSTVCKRAKHLTVNLPQTASDGPIHVVVDSTGLKIFGEGEWKVRKHGYSKRRTWRKLHLGVDSATHEIQAVVLTEASVDDAEVASDLLDQTSEPIEQFSADGAYDKRKVYSACEKRRFRRLRSHHAEMHASGSTAIARHHPCRVMRTCARSARWGAEDGSRSLVIISVLWLRQRCCGSRPSSGIICSLVPCLNK